MTYFLLATYCMTCLFFGHGVVVGFRESGDPTRGLRLWAYLFVIIAMWPAFVLMEAGRFMGRAE